MVQQVQFKKKEEIKKTDPWQHAIDDAAKGKNTNLFKQENHDASKPDQPISFLRQKFENIISQKK